MKNINDNTIIETPSGEFTVGEIKNSNRIQKSATPKHDLSWYVKWTASVFILISAMFRIQGPEYDNLDTLFSFVGVTGWMIVGLLWKDRALLLLNGVLMFVLASGLLNWFLGN
jgi:hypothetical protein|tara:strand:+ start:212 stop:550 length:339 start_codon:yes stop_codon:yes gene_type:complete